MNFTINIDKIGDISMQNLILIGVFAIFFLTLLPMSSKSNMKSTRKKQDEAWAR